MKNGHYKWMRFILKIAFSLIVTTRQYVGNPIDCVHTKDIPEDVLNTYCWIHSTYALKSMFLKKLGKEVPYPGVGNSEGKTEDRKVYKYYQWVCFCLFFQVIHAGKNISKTLTTSVNKHQWLIIHFACPQFLLSKLNLKNTNCLLLSLSTRLRMQILN
jgi:Innexin